MSMRIYIYMYIYTINRHNTSIHTHYTARVKILFNGGIAHVRLVAFYISQLVSITSSQNNKKIDFDLINN